MEKKSNEGNEEAHDQLPSDKTLKDKIHKHLSNIDDKISEDDLKNINTSTGIEAPEAIPQQNSGEINTDKEKSADDDESYPKKEMPTSWDING